MADQDRIAMTRSSPPWTALRQFWLARSPRERTWTVGAALALALALVWHFSARPAYQLWQQAPETRARLVQQIAAMQELARQAGDLQKQPRLDAAQSRQALGRSLQELGGQMSADGDRIRARLARVPTAALAAWLQSLGPQTGARLVQASLREEAPGWWSGQLVLELP